MKSYNLTMSLIDKLLASASQQELKDCESAAQLHLKQVLTTINKHTLEDITPALVPYCLARFGKGAAYSDATTTTRRTCRWRRLRPGSKCNSCGTARRSAEESRKSWKSSWITSTSTRRRSSKGVLPNAHLQKKRNATPASGSATIGLTEGTSSTGAGSAATSRPSIRSDHYFIGITCATPLRLTRSPTLSFLLLALAPRTPPEPISDIKSVVPQRLHDSPAPLVASTERKPAGCCLELDEKRALCCSSG